MKVCFVFLGCGVEGEDRWWRDEDEARLMVMVITGKPILVPLTTSLYVPGVLADPENVIVDVGTGFYVEKVRCLLNPPSHH